MGKDLEEEKDKDRDSEEKPSSPVVLMKRDAAVREKAEAKGAFLSGLKYRQQEGDYSFEHTVWRVFEMLWEKVMAWGHMHETDGDVEDELCQNIIAWLATMSGHGEEDTRKERLMNLFHDIDCIMEEEDSGKRVHKLLNLTGLAAFHHDIGFRQTREKTEYLMQDEEKAEIEVQIRAKMDEWESQQKIKAEVQTR